MATNRVFNFAAGPACLPIEVLQEAQADLLSYKGSGMSVMEVSHRSKEFDGIITTAEADLRKLLSIPDNYKVVFLQGGASTQFASIAYNFTAAGDTADYVVTGAWSKKAFEEAGKLGVKANLVAKGDNKSIPARDSWKLSPNAKYVHYCDNETIGVSRGGCARTWGGAVCGCSCSSADVSPLFDGCAGLTERAAAAAAALVCRCTCQVPSLLPPPSPSTPPLPEHHTKGRRVPRRPRRGRRPPDRRHVLQLPVQARGRVQVSARGMLPQRGARAQHAARRDAAGLPLACSRMRHTRLACRSHGAPHATPSPTTQPPDPPQTRRSPPPGTP